eukprot:365800-Chlamydomonas_euryale.AAC.6
MAATAPGAAPAQHVPWCLTLQQTPHSGGRKRKQFAQRELSGRTHFAFGSLGCVRDSGFFGLPPTSDSDGHQCAPHALLLAHPSGTHATLVNTCAGGAAGADGANACTLPPPRVGGKVVLRGHSVAVCDLELFEVGGRSFRLTRRNVQPLPPRVRRRCRGLAETSSATRTEPSPAARTERVPALAVPRAPGTQDSCGGVDGSDGSGGGDGSGGSGGAGGSSAGGGSGACEAPAYSREAVFRDASLARTVGDASLDPCHEPPTQRDSHKQSQACEEQAQPNQRLGRAAEVQQAPEAAAQPTVPRKRLCVTVDLTITDDDSD